ncbi:ATP-binding protein [Paenibacillus albiflavus]|nr:ATP-binding protein [Paenibacillus albiflavus]
MKKSTVKLIVTVLLFISVLLGMRWVWSEMFASTDSLRAVNGVLDMRGRDLGLSPTIPLKGEWQFYPDQFITYEDIPTLDVQSRNIQVPGDWSHALSDKSTSSYGSGTYRLKILVDPLKKPVTLWARSIQATSSIEINGISEGAIGTLAANAAAYKPRNISYTAFYDKDGTQELEVLVQVANFDDPYNGGVLRSIRFGSSDAIDYVRWYSIGFQLVTFIVLFIHGLYIGILYLFNPREWSLFTFGFLILSVAISIVAGHDNLLMLWLPLNYTWGLKLKLISLVSQTFITFLLIRKFAGGPSKDRWIRIYSVAHIAYTAFLLAAPAAWVNATVDFGIFYIFHFLPVIFFIYYIGIMIFKQQIGNDAVFVLLTAISIMSNFLWSLWNAYNDVTVVYYPFDIIAAIIGFSTYWFKQYFRNANERALLTEQLKQADKLKDQFLANTSHELRTPLHGIMNIAQTVVTKDREKMSERSVKDMELLITISQRMSHLLGDLLDVAQLQEHRIALQQEPLKIQSVIPGVIAMLKFMTEGKPIDLRMNIAESMPLVMADEKRLVQIAYNLLHNALKYTEEGTISVSAEIRDGDAIIHVSDTGVGMDEETQARIFLRYEQGSYGINDGSGIGLGLNICKQLVELHGGTLTVCSKLNKGSVFSFNLPLADMSNYSTLSHNSLASHETKEEANHKSNQFLIPDTAFEEEVAAAELIPSLLNEGKANILAVDDDPINLNVLTGILSTEPYNIMAVKSAREALELLGTQQWDLLIADVMMPHMSGYELTQQVRERYSVSELPVLLLTARSQPADIYTGFSSGANDYVTKPVDAIELRYRIRALITLKQSINERLRMEAAYLQAQIHPHFLFNTLNSIMALSDIDTEKMQDLGDAFASYLRISFDFLNTGELVKLSHELELVKAYLYVEKERFQDRLSVIWEVNADRSLLLPPLSIQPLIENAVIHGILKQRRGGTVRIQITKQEGFTLVEVQDDGQGMDPDKINQILSPTLKNKSGIGISNTNRRLIQLYGQGLSIISKPNEGTTVSFIIPDRQVKQAT